MGSIPSKEDTIKQHQIITSTNIDTSPNKIIKLNNNNNNSPQIAMLYKSWYNKQKHNNQ